MCYNQIMIALTSVDLFNILRQKFGETEAKAVTEYIEVQAEDKMAKISLLINKDLENIRMEMQKTAATKEDVYLIKEEIAAVKNEITKLEGGLLIKMSETKTDIIKWVFTFFATLSIMIIGLYLKK